jgi:hypothetical protein
MTPTSYGQPTAPNSHLAGSQQHAVGSKSSIPRHPVLDRVLLEFDSDNWNASDAFQGTQIFGGTGSGKTTGSGASIAKAFLEAGFGGLVLTAKADDAERWKSLTRSVGRTGDVIEITTTSNCTFNILQYEYERGGGFTHNVVSLLLGAMTTGGENATAGSEPYWAEALREMLIHTVDAVLMGSRGEQVLQGKPYSATRPELRLSDLDRFIRSAPQRPFDVYSDAWRERSYCWKQLEAADALAVQGNLPEPQRRDLDQTMGFWLNDFPRLASRTRSIIVSTFTAKVAGLLRSPIRELFFEKTNDDVSPDNSFVEKPGTGGWGGKIIILNLPVKTYGEVGRLVQVLYKTIWQRAAERRAELFSLDESQRRDRVSSGQLTHAAAARMSPAFLWADESQYFTTQEDLLFQQTARASRVATVYLTQNIGNYKAVLGRSGGDASVYSLLGNLQTKIFHTNGDVATNQFAEQSFGKRWSSLRSTSRSQSDTVQDGRVSLNSSAGTNLTMQQVSVVEAREFTLLACGGRRYSFQVAAWIFLPGRNLKNPPGNDDSGRNSVFHIFQQML